jgi:hypothetical protein
MGVFGPASFGDGSVSGVFGDASQEVRRRKEAPLERMAETLRHGES